MRSDGKDSMAWLLGDVERLSTESYVSRCCTYFKRRGDDGYICLGCPAYRFNDCTKAVFCDLAGRLRDLGVESGNAVKARARGETMYEEDADAGK